MAAADCARPSCATSESAYFLAPDEVRHILLRVVLDCLGGVMCRECGGDKLRVIEYDLGICRETGYYDAGERYECDDCGATGDADELLAA